MASRERLREVQRRAACVLRGNDIDTDRIIPARFLRAWSSTASASTPSRTTASRRRATIRSTTRASRAPSILLVDQNFGCGSSREHAPQALMRCGIRAFVGESFADIFFGNCVALGIPCVTLARRTSRR